MTNCRLVTAQEITEAEAEAWGLPWQDGVWWIPQDTDLYTILVLGDIGHDSGLSDIILAHLRKYPYDLARTHRNTLTRRQNIPNK